MSELGRLFAHAFRSLRKTPGFSAVAIGTLALGIGANAAVLSIARALLLRPFAVPNLDRVVSILETPPAHANASAGHDGGQRRTLVPRADFEDLAGDRGPWKALAGCSFGDVRLGGIGDPEHIAGSRVTAEFFAVMDVAPALGRVFAPPEYLAGRDPVAVVSDAFWRRRLAAVPSAVGEALLLDGRKYTVVGVMPRDFAYPPGGVEVWTPDAPTPVERSDRQTPAFLVVGRLKDGVSIGAARTRALAVARRLDRDFPETFAGKSFVTVPLRDAHTGAMAPFVFVFEAAALLVLTIACVNVAGLLLARGARRRREMAVRSALGASRARLLAHIFAEWAVLSTGAAALALWISDASLRLIRVGLPASIARWVPGWDRIGLDTSALLFTGAAALFAGLLFSVAPAWALRRASLTESLGGSGRSPADPGRGRTQTFLVAGQVALALVLLSGAAVLLRGFHGLVSRYRDFDPDGVITMRLHVSPERESDRVGQSAFFDRVLAGFRAIPGVETASLSRQVPADMGPMPAAPFEIEGRTALAAGERLLVDVQAVSTGYFRTLRIPLGRGRDFRDGDRAGAPDVAIVSEELARRMGGPAHAIGTRVRTFDGNVPGGRLTVVGVAADVKQYWSDRSPRTTLYRPFLQAPSPGMFAILRTRGNPESLLPAARRAVASVDRAQPVDEIRTMNGVVLESTAILRIAAGLLAATGALALVLATIGVGGLIAYNVSQRTHEIGIRMALGARSPDVVRLVIKRGVSLGLLGLAAGFPLTLLLGRVLGSVLYGMADPDPITILAVGAALTAITAASAWVPARRASRVDPVTALREE
jgi:putative ABC transport system permease protein